jgi:hypothetical protein
MQLVANLHRKNLDCQIGGVETGRKRPEIEIHGLRLALDREQHCHQMLVDYWKFVGEFILNLTSFLDDSAGQRVC